MATVGELVVNLRAATASFSQDLDKAKYLSFDTANQIQRSFARVGTAIAAELATGAAAITAFTAKSIDMVAQIADAGAKTGISSEQFSVYAYAAEKTGVDVDSLSRALVIMDKNLEKSNESTLAGKAAHSALGTLFHGNVPIFHDTSDAFQQITERLAAMGDTQQRTALQTLIFGRSSSELTRMIDENADGFTRASAEAAKYGVVISTEAGENAIKFKETLSELDAVMHGLGIRLASELLPYLQTLADQLLVFMNDAAQSQKTISAMVTSVQVLATGVVGLAAAFAEAGAAVAFFVTANLGPEYYGSISNYLAAMKQGYENLKSPIITAAGIIESIWTPALQNAAHSMEQLFTIADSLTKKLNQQSTELADGKIVKAIQDIIDKEQEQIATFGMSVDEVNLWKLAQLGASQAVIDKYKELENVLAMLQEKQALGTGPFDTTAKLPSGDFTNALNTQSLSMESYNNAVEESNRVIQEWSANNSKAAATIRDSLLTVQQKYNIELANCNELVSQGLITQDEATAHMKQYEDALRTTKEGMHDLDMARHTVSSGLETLFDAAIFHAGSFKQALAGVLEQMAMMIIKLEVITPLIDALFGAGPPCQHS